MLKTDFKAEPREFRLKDYVCRDHGTITLVPEDDRTHEFVTFRTASGRECDFSATPWGYYLGPSLNSRLKDEGFRSALMTNGQGQVYVVAIEEDRMEQFEAYLKHNEARVVLWLDSMSGEQALSLSANAGADVSGASA